MPIYEFHCLVHGRFEVILPTLPDNECHKCLWESGGRQCHYLAPLVPSLVVMKPDNMWAGHMTDHGYLTSSSKLAAIRRDKNIEVLNGQNDVDAMKREAAKARQSWDEKLEKDAREIFLESAANTGIIDSFGELTPEATDTWRNDRIHQAKTPVRKD